MVYIMKEKRCPKNVQVVPEVEAVPVEMDQSKTFVINCTKCGAALSAKSGRTAYICPVCGTVLLMRTGVRVVKDIPVHEKQIHLTLTESAAKFILQKDSQTKAAMMANATAKGGVCNGGFQGSLETLIADKLRFQKYEEGDLLKVDLGVNQLTINVVKAPQNQK